MNTARRVLQNSMFNFVAGISQRIGQAFIFILIARTFTLNETGVYKLAITYTSILLALSFWGLDQLLIRDVAKDNKLASSYLSGFVGLRLVLAVFLWLCLALVMPLFPYANSSKHLILVMALTIIPDSIANIYYSLWVAFEDVRTLSLIAFLFSLLRLIGGIFLLSSDRALTQIAYWFLSIGFAEMLINVWVTHSQNILIRFHWQIDFSFWARNLKAATPLIFVSFILLIEYQFDTVILSLFWPEEEIGTYGTAVTLFSLLLLFTRSYQLAIFPVLSQAYHSSQASLQRVYSLSTTYLLIGALLITIFVSFLAPLIIRFVYGPGHEKAGQILSILAWAFLITAFNVPNSRLMIVADKQNIVAYFAILSLSGNLILNIWLVPRLGSLGAAWARVLSMPLYSIPAFFYVQYRICSLSWPQWREIQRFRNRIWVKRKR